MSLSPLLGEFPVTDDWPYVDLIWSCGLMRSMMSWISSIFDECLVARYWSYKIQCWPNMVIWLYISEWCLDHRRSLRNAQWQVIRHKFNLDLIWSCGHVAGDWPAIQKLPGGTFMWTCQSQPYQRLESQADTKCLAIVLSGVQNAVCPRLVEASLTMTRG